MQMHDNKDKWQIARYTETVDWPTGTNGYDPVGDPTQRLVSYMVDGDEEKLTPINVYDRMPARTLVLRARFDDTEGSATVEVFGACLGEKTVKRLGSIAFTGGTQTDENELLFAASATVTDYTHGGMTAQETTEDGTGIVEVLLNTTIYDRIWLGVSSIGGPGITVEYNWF